MSSSGNTDSSAVALASNFISNCEEKLKMNQYWYSAQTLATIVDVIQNNATKVCFMSTPSVYFSLTNDALRQASSVFDFDDQWKDEPGYFQYDFHHPENIPSEFHHSFDMVVIDPPFITEEVWAQYITAIKLLLVEDADNPLKPETSLPSEQKEEEEEQEEKIDFDNIDPFKSSNKTANSPKRSGNNAVEQGQEESESILHFPGGKGHSGPIPSQVPAPKANVKNKILLTTIGEHERWLYDEIGVSCRMFRPSIPHLIYQYRLYTNFPSDALEQLNPEIEKKESS